MKRPTTDGDLWDYCQRLFGVGDWDEQMSDEPFWKFRAKEITKVKARRSKRKVDIEALVIAADYCRAKRIDIRNPAWLYQYLGDSRSWWQERQRALSAAALDELVEGAVHAETDPEWRDRLIRARGEHRQEVYEAWRNERAKSTSPR